MYLCYIDESGTPNIPGNTTHYILAGLSLPVWKWRECEREIEAIKKKYSLEDSEIHVAWLIRPYIEQSKAPDFEACNFEERKSLVGKYRNMEILRLQRLKKQKLKKQTEKNFKKTEKYVHLTYEERFSLAKDLAETISNWEFARLFAECVDKIYFDPRKATQSIDEQAFTQVVSRFEQYLSFSKKKNHQERNLGLLIHDNNDTVARKHTNLMKKFHKEGTYWTEIKHIVETPLFVDSQLTSMVQMADLCGYALRRYLENQEEELFRLIFKRADRQNDKVVGVRHFTHNRCECAICLAHRK